MTFEIAKQAVDQLYYNIMKIKKDFNIDHLSHNGYSIFFFGGEPLLCYDSIIKPTIEYCKEKYPEIFFNYNVTTNGTLLTEDKIEFFTNNNVVL